MYLFQLGIRGHPLGRVGTDLISELRSTAVTTQKISIGILSPIPEARDSLSTHVESTQLATVKIVVDEYCGVEDDYPTQRFIEGRPDIVFVDMQDQRAGIKALSVLHAVLPETWLFACGAPNDPQLIIETMQAGAREFQSKPVSSRSVAMAFSRYIDEKDRLRAGSKTRGRIYCITSAKGGAGATSVAVNLAMTLSGAAETHVAILDLNSPVGDAASYLNVKPQFSISDALSSAPRLDSVLLETFMTKVGSVSLLPGPKQFRATSASPPALSKLLRIVSGTYTHTFIDLPSSIDQEILQTVTDSSEAVLVVMTPELPAIWRTHRLMALLASSGCSDRLRLILNRANSRDEITDREITRALNHPIYFRLPNNYSAAIQAINKGKPIIEVNHSSLATGYRQLTQELTGMAFQKSRRTFSNLFFLGL
jgi:pilus assembly protein CpaE